MARSLRLTQNEGEREERSREGKGGINMVGIRRNREDAVLDAEEGDQLLARGQGGWGQRRQEVTDHPLRELRELGLERDTDADNQVLRTPSSEVSVSSSGRRTMEGF